MPAGPETPALRRSRGAALAVAAGILLSRLAGLVRERVFAHYLGSSDAAGAFKAALRIPNLLQNLFGEGVLSASFIPVYARLLAEGQRELAGQVASVVATLLTLLVAALVGLGTWASPLLIDLIAPGFSGDVRELTIRLVQVMFSGVGLLVLSAWCLGILNSHRRFFLSYVAPVLWNAAIVAALVAFGAPRMSSRAGQMRLAEIAAWGTCAGAALQLLVQLPVALRLVHHFRPSLAARLAAVRDVLRNFVPVVVARGVVQVSAYIDQLLSSYLGAQAVAAIGYAQTLYLLPISLFGMSVAAAELPAMAGEVGAEDEVAARLRERLTQGLARIAFFVVPSAVAFVVVGDVVVATLFQTGRFARGDVVVVWMILAGYTVGLVAVTQARLLSSAFYALRDTRTPLRFALARVTLSALAGWAVCLPLRRRFGWPPEVAAAALTAAAGLAGWIEFLLLRRALRRRIGAFTVGSRGLGGLARLWAAALLAGGLAFAVARFLPTERPLLRGALGLGAYGLGFGGLALLLDVEGARPLLASLRRRLR